MSWHVLIWPAWYGLLITLRWLRVRANGGQLPDEPWYYRGGEVLTPNGHPRKVIRNFSDYLRDDG